MANREALRQLQSRLAERLRLARAEARPASWLALECAGQGLLVPLAVAGEIFPVGSVLPVAHTQAWFLGVANLRGGLHGVVDLAAFLGLRAALARDAVREQARLLTLNASLGAHSALLVDRLAGLRSAEQLSACSQDDTRPRPGFAAGLWRDEQGRCWQEIDLAALARYEPFLTIAA
jgi:twitching motility protein PilI